MVNEHELAALLAQHARAYGVPGAVMGIWRDGVLTTAHHGVADVRTGEPITLESRFSLGSLTKSMLATAITRLAIPFDESVAVHVPELRHAEWAQRATVRDLLANQSGIPLSEATEFGFEARQAQPLSGLAADLASGEPTAGVWSYSNAGWSLLGRVVETVTGQPWEVAVGATDGPRVTGHANGPAPVPPLLSRAYGPAGASLTSTVTELSAFAAQHVLDSRLEPLRETQEELAIHGWFDAWCLGWARFDWPGGPVWGWDGLVSGERSILRISPERQTAIALMTNSDTGRALYRTLFAELMDMPPLRLASTETVNNLDCYEGVYAWPDRRIEVTATQHGLVLEGDGEVKTAVPIDERTFLVDAADPDNPTVTFGAFDESGRPNVLYVMLWGLPRRWGPGLRWRRP